MTKQKLPTKKTNGRPPKISQDWLDKAKTLLRKTRNALIHTDEDLLFLINDGLPEEKQISQRTFEEYKAGKSLENPISNAYLKDFSRLMKKALLIERDNLFRRMGKDTKARQRRAWIIERKFDQWNLRLKQESTGKDGQPIDNTLTITFKE